MGDNLFENLASGRPSLGIAITIPSPEMVELFGQAGWDAMYASMHASRISWDDLAHMVRAADRSGITACARIPIQPWVGTYNPGLAVDAHHAFGLGAKVVIASVHDSREVQELVEAEHEEFHDMADFTWFDQTNEANLETWKSRRKGGTLSVPMIESHSSWDDLERIMAVPDLHAVMLGMSDLSRILGVHRDFFDPRIQDAIKRFVDLGRTHDVATIVNTNYPDDTKNAFQVTVDRATHLFDLGVNVVFAVPALAFLYFQARSLRDAIREGSENQAVPATR